MGSACGLCTIGLLPLCLLLVIEDGLGCEGLTLQLVVAFVFVLPFWAFAKARPIEVTNDGI